MFKKVSGTKDILPEEVGAWQDLEAISRNTFSLFNYGEIRPPLIEEAALFNRSLGESTEIVQKQMFIVNNKDETYALRPEATASVVRAYIENNLDKTGGFAKFYYIGPMFRLERPQKGRLRQFQHIGCEAIGSFEAHLDVEIISLADTLLRNFGIEGYRIKLNSIGCASDKKNLTEALRRGLKANAQKLCAECKNRLLHNPLRILDCKNDSCKEVTAKLKINLDYLCPDCQGHFNQVKSGLDSLKIEYQLTPHLVRGLDYYTGTVFEISHQDLGSQDALGAGGRYNNLVKELGGPEAGAIGFALGTERLLLVSRSKKEKNKTGLVYLVTLGDKAKARGLNLLYELRQKGIAVDTDYEGKSLKGALRQANDLSARFVLLLGDNEIEKGTLSLKDMRSGEQKEINALDLTREIGC